MAKEAKKIRDRIGDSALMETLIKTEKDCVETCFSRMELQQSRRSFGGSAVCCCICHLGPCRITKKAPRGVCGADEDTVVARNYLREVVGGTAAHSDHARYLVLRLKKAAEGHGEGYEIGDERALRQAARLYKIKEAGRSKEEVALNLANLFLSEFTAQEETLKTLTLAPVKQQSIWKSHHIWPQGIDRTIVESMHHTTMGADHDYRDLLMQAFRVALADGWGGSRIATIASDILSGMSWPTRSRAERGDLNDPKRVSTPSVKKPLVAGFSVDAIKYALGGTYRTSFRPLNDAIVQGRIQGVVGIVGCNNPKTNVDSYIKTLTQELIQRNILVLKAGCAALSSAKEGILTPAPEAAIEKAGNGLREVCEALGIPPVLPMGGCEDHSRMLEVGTEIVIEGGLGNDLSQIPAVGVAPEWMGEKAVAIGSYWVASGIEVILGHPFHSSGSPNVTRFLNEETQDLFGASFHVYEDPQEAVAVILDLLDAARERLGINRKMERKLFDMKDRRGLDV